MMSMFLTVKVKSLKIIAIQANKITKHTDNMMVPWTLVMMKIFTAHMVKLIQVTMHTNIPDRMKIQTITIKIQIEQSFADQMEIIITLLTEKGIHRFKESEMIISGGKEDVHCLIVMMTLITSNNGLLPQSLNIFERNILRKKQVIVQTILILEEMLHKNVFLCLAFNQ